MPIFQGSDPNVPTSGTTVSGTVSVGNAVSGVVSVSGVVGVTQVTSPWITSGVAIVNNAVSGIVSVSGTVATSGTVSNALSGVVSVSGTVATSGVVTNALSGVVSVSGTANVLPKGTQVTGTLTGSNTAEIDCDGMGTIFIHIPQSGFTGIIQFEGSFDGTTWPITLAGVDLGLYDGNLYNLITNASTSLGPYRASVAGLKKARLRALGITGTATYSMGVSVSQAIVEYVISPGVTYLETGAGELTGTNNSGKVSLDVNISNASVPVATHGVNQGAASGVAWPVFTSQAVSGVMSVSGTVSGNVAISGAVSGVVSVSGSVAANQGTASGVAWPVFTSQAVSGVVSVSGSVAANQGTASGVAWPVFTSQAVSGVVSVSGAVAANQGTASGVAWPVFTSQVVSANITGTVSVSGAVNASQGAASSTAWPVAHVASHTVAQAASVYHTNVQSNTVVNIKTSSGVVYGYTIYNPNQAALAYCQFFKVTAASVTLSSAVAPFFTVAVPSAAAFSRVFQVPVGFASGIAVAATLSNSGSTANAIGLSVEVEYV